MIALRMTSILASVFSVLMLQAMIRLPVNRLRVLGRIGRCAATHTLRMHRLAPSGMMRWLGGGGRMTVLRRSWLTGAWLAAALGSGIATASAQDSESWSKCVNKNDAYSNDVQIQACTALIRSGRENPRNTAIAFNNRGIAYYAKDDYDNAISDFSEAINLDPNYADAFQSRASAYSDKGDHDHAIADYNQSIRLNQKNPIAYNNRCDELLLIGRAQAAIADCNESLRQRPNHANTLMHRGNAYLAAGEYRKAIADYDAALAQKPKDAWSLYGRGYAKVKLGQTSGGNADMNAAKAILDAIVGAFEKRGIRL